MSDGNLHRVTPDNQTLIMGVVPFFQMWALIAATAARFAALTYLQAMTETTKAMRLVPMRHQPALDSPCNHDQSSTTMLPAPMKKIKHSNLPPTMKMGHTYLKRASGESGQNFLQLFLGIKIGRA